MSRCWRIKKPFITTLLISGIKDFVIRKDGLEGGFVCAICHTEFSMQSNCRRHVKEKHFGLNQLPCPFCNQPFLKRHIQGHISTCKGAAMAVTESCWSRCWKWFFMSIVSTKSVSSRRSKWTSPVNINWVHLCCLHQGLLGQVKLQETHKGETFWPEPAAMPFLSPDLPEAIYSGPHDFLSKSHPISWPSKLIRELCDNNPRRICERSCPVNKPGLLMSTLR